MVFIFLNFIISTYLRPIIPCVYQYLFFQLFLTLLLLRTNENEPANQAIIQNTQAGNLETSSKLELGF